MQLVAQSGGHAMGDKKKFSACRHPIVLFFSKCSSGKRKFLFSFMLDGLYWPGKHLALRPEEAFFFFFKFINDTTSFSKPKSRNFALIYLRSSIAFSAANST